LFFQKKKKKKKKGKERKIGGPKEICLTNKV